MEYEGIVGLAWADADYSEAMNALGQLDGEMSSLFVLPLIFGGIFAIYTLIVWWKVFEKAGQAGWKCLIPIYNLVILFNIAWMSGWWVLLAPIGMIINCFKLAEKFGKSTGFGVGLWFLNPIFMGILAFGEAKYQSTEETK